MWGLLAACGLAVYFVLSASGTQPGAEGAAEDTAVRAEPLPPIAMAGARCASARRRWRCSGSPGPCRCGAKATDVNLLNLRVSWIVPVLGLSLIAAVIAYVAGIGAALAGASNWPRSSG